MLEDTIAAISTPIAQGGIGVVRISGPNTKRVASCVFKSISNKSIFDLAGYQALFGSVYDKEGSFDEAILLNFNKPNSYTGEDVIEISVHSGIYILKRLLRAVLDSGARLATAGEFTKTAFINGKMSLTQAESVMDLIGAQNNHALNMAYGLKQGVMFEEITNLINSIIKISSHINAYIDYPEEDVENLEELDLKQIILIIKDRLVNLIKTFDVGKILKEGISTVIIGKPNVGKSSIMNLLSGHKKSIVTNIPGTTRDVIEENILLNDIMLNIFDTAGIRETSDLVESFGVSLAKQKILEADIILAVFDCSRAFDYEDEFILKQIKNQPQKKVIALINKIDLPHKLDIEKIKLSINDIIYITTKELSSRDIISDKIKSLLNLNNIDNSSLIISNERHLFCLKQSLNELNLALASLNDGVTYDALAVNLEAAVAPLMELTGQEVSESIIDNIFKNFCVGK